MGRIAIAMTLSIATAACSGRANENGQVASGDSSFAELQTRGASVMGVDQYASQHVFETLPDGGRIVLEMRADGDTAAVAEIRTHMRAIVTDFRNGDFAKPFQVHAENVPGTRTMADRSEQIQYHATNRPRGAEVRIVTSDLTALAAIHEFLAFQRDDHRAAGHDGH
ncbi:MAG: hypothetical protein ACRENI_08215 [Gemmatimonadaceae bacterium]